MPLSRCPLVNLFSTKVHRVPEVWRPAEDRDPTGIVHRCTEASNNRDRRVAIHRVRCTCNRDHRNNVVYHRSKWAVDHRCTVRRKELLRTLIRRSSTKADHRTKVDRHTDRRTVANNHQCPVDTDRRHTLAVDLRRVVVRPAAVHLGPSDREDR